MRHLYTFRFYYAARHLTREISLLSRDEDEARVAARQWLTAEAPAQWEAWRITSVRVEPADMELFP